LVSAMLEKRLNIRLFFHVFIAYDTFTLAAVHKACFILQLVTLLVLAKKEIFIVQSAAAFVTNIFIASECLRTQI
jgi:hypothetical protein